MRKTRILIAAIVAIGVLAGGMGTVQATHDNPNWGDNPGNSDQVEDCSTGHINPHDDETTKRSADDCGTNRGNA